MPTNYQLILITAPERKTAEDIAGGLLAQHLAACVTLVDSVSSLYWWENAIHKSSEVLLIAKTRTALLPEVLLFVKARHPYNVPEVISFQIADGNPAYLNWLGANTKFTAAPGGEKETAALNPPITDKPIT